MPKRQLLPGEQGVTDIPLYDIHIEESIRNKLLFLGQACQEVAKEMGKGHAEKVYQEALSLELQSRKIFHISEQTLPLMYKGYQIGGNHSIRLDICLQNFLDFIYELKATNTPIQQANLWQLLRYMRIKKYNYGAVVNFNQSLSGKLEIQFVIHHENEYYLFDILKQEGSLIDDYTLESEIDYNPSITFE